MSIADSSDVEAALGRTLTDGESTRVDGLLEIASAAVFAETGYYFEAASYTIGRWLRGPKLRIPATVDTVESVTKIDQVDGTETTLSSPTEYLLRNSTLYGLRVPYSSRFRGVYYGRPWVEVAFTVTEAAPAEVVALVAGMVATTLDTPGANVASEAAGPFSRSFVNTSGRVYLSASDKAVLRRYKQPKPAIALQS